jgi:two-component system response regulator QseB
MTRVLVIEDEPEIRSVVAEALADEGYIVGCAQDGAVGLSLLQGQQHHLAIVDLMMPGMDGRQFVQECRADPRCAALQIIVITAMRASQLDNLDVQAVIPKPFDLGDLVDTVFRLAPP